MSQYAQRPLEPHPDQLDYVWPADTSEWEPCSNVELAPNSWSGSGSFGMRTPLPTHMLPTELAEHELGIQLYSDTLPPPWADYPERPAEPHPDQLDPGVWPARDRAEWGTVAWSDSSGAYGYSLVPPEWLGTETYPTSDGELTELKSGYMTSGELYVWQLEHDLVPEPGEPDPPDDPEPEPELDLAPAVLAFAGYPADSPAVDELVEQHLPVVMAQVRTYTRGRGFSDAGHPDVNLRAVIVSATARSMSNPTGAGSLRLGNMTTNPGIYAGWTLPELAILHGYRRRSA